MIDRINGRLALLLAVLGVLLLVLLGWYAFVSPQRSKAATLDGQVSQTQAQLAATHAFLRSGSGPKSVAELRRLRVAVPDDVMMSTILRQLSWAAGRARRQDRRRHPVAGGGERRRPGRPDQPERPGPLLPPREVHAPAPRHGQRGRTARFMRPDASTPSTGSSSRAASKGGAITATIALDAFVHGAAPAPAVAPGTVPTTALQTTTP